jgi:hypothetical protein
MEQVDQNGHDDEARHELGCGHGLHRQCWRGYQQSVHKHGDPAACPVCRHIESNPPAGVVAEDRPDAYQVHQQVGPLMTLTSRVGQEPHVARASGHVRRLRQIDRMAPHVTREWVNDPHNPPRAHQVALDVLGVTHPQLADSLDVLTADDYQDVALAVMNQGGSMRPIGIDQRGARRVRRRLGDVARFSELVAHPPTSETDPWGFGDDDDQIPNDDEIQLNDLDDLPGELPAQTVFDRIEAYMREAVEPESREPLIEMCELLRRAGAERVIRFVNTTEAPLDCLIRLVAWDNNVDVTDEQMDAIANLLLQHHGDVTGVPTPGMMGVHAALLRTLSQYHPILFVRVIVAAQSAEKRAMWSEMWEWNDRLEHYVDRLNMFVVYKCPESPEARLNAVASCLHKAHGRMVPQLSTRLMARRIMNGEDFDLETYSGITAEQFRGVMESLCRPERRRKVEGESNRLLLF